jgi:hypothetical protein
MDNQVESKVRSILGLCNSPTELTLVAPKKNYLDRMLELDGDGTAHTDGEDDFGTIGFDQFSSTGNDDLSHLDLTAAPPSPSSNAIHHLLPTHLPPRTTPIAAIASSPFHASSPFYGSPAAHSNNNVHVSVAAVSTAIPSPPLFSPVFSNNTTSQTSTIVNGMVSLTASFERSEIRSSGENSFNNEHPKKPSGPIPMTELPYSPEGFSEADPADDEDELLSNIYIRCFDGGETEEYQELPAIFHSEKDVDREYCIWGISHIGYLRFSGGRRLPLYILHFWSVLDVYVSIDSIEQVLFGGSMPSELNKFIRNQTYTKKGGLTSTSGIMQCLLSKREIGLCTDFCNFLIDYWRIESNPEKILSWLEEEMYRFSRREDGFDGVLQSCDKPGCSREDYPWNFFQCGCSRWNHIGPIGCTRNLYSTEENIVRSIQYRRKARCADCGGGKVMSSTRL